MSDCNHTRIYSGKRGTEKTPKWEYVCQDCGHMGFIVTGFWPTSAPDLYRETVEKFQVTK